MNIPPKNYLSRRKFLKSAAIVAALGTGRKITASNDEKEKSASTTKATDYKDSVRDFLKKAVMKKEDIDRFLDPRARIWAKYDSELGYLLRNSWMRDGMDGAYTLSRYCETGERKIINFADQPCRINTYGNSFTQGHQVSDGETWQEVLAAHFCEPIRNFGIGGHGFYQAYRRMLRQEKTQSAADHLIFNIWGDDHQRSINAWRYLTYVDTWSEAASRTMLHGNPWDYARLDPKTGELVEIDNDFSTPQSLYQLCDEEFVFEKFENDPVVHIMVALHKGNVNKDLLRQMASVIDIDLQLTTPDQTRDDAWWLYNAYAWRVSMKLIDKLQDYCKKHEKKLMILLSYPEPSVREICEGKDRDSLEYLDWHPKQFRDYVRSKQIPMIDTLEDHLQEFKTFKLSPKEYTDRYYIGHYNPKGNHFFAFAIKDRLVQWLNPKPPAYKSDQQTLIRFEGYLP